MVCTTGTAKRNVHLRVHTYDFRLASIKQVVRPFNLTHLPVFFNIGRQKGKYESFMSQHVRTRLATHYADGCRSIKIVSRIMGHIHN